MIKQTIAYLWLVLVGAAAILAVLWLFAFAPPLARNSVVFGFAIPLSALALVFGTLWAFEVVRAAMSTPGEKPR